MYEGEIDVDNGSRPQHRGDNGVRARRGAARTAAGRVCREGARRIAGRGPARRERERVAAPRPIAGSSTPTWRCRASPAPPASTSSCARCARRGRWRNMTVTLIAQNNEELARAAHRPRRPRALRRSAGERRWPGARALRDGVRRRTAISRRSICSGLALDLSDRGVDGRRAPGDIDAYLYTERGIYRPGERVRLIGADPRSRSAARSPIVNRRSSSIARTAPKRGASA